MDMQSEVIAFLKSPAAHGGRQDKVEQLETHGALVFLAGVDAYKIKRAVRYSYMDFSTLDRRRAAIEREFEINQPHAPDIYLKVSPITRETNGQLRIGGTGIPVEWALHMRRFEQAALLRSISDRGGLSPALARQLADTVLDSHRLAPRIRDDHGDTRMRRIAADLIAGLATIDHGMKPFHHQDVAAAIMRQLDRAAPVLQARGKAGHIARCHGDLHLNNIVMWKGTPTLFDAIEFDENLATIDTLYDLAFLVMDLDHRQHRVAANIVLNRYLARSHAHLDIDGLAALPLFLGLRSAIRGLVTVQRAMLRPALAVSRDRDIAAARSNLDDALRYLSPAAPRLVAVGGFSGTGKTTLAASLAPLLDPPPGALHIRTDLERKALFGVTETERLPPDSYTKEASNTIYAVVMDKARRALAAGHSVVVDAVFSTAGERDAMASLARDTGVGFTGLWLSAPADILKARVTARTHDASDATADVIDLQLQRGSGAVEWLQVDAGGTPEATSAAARSRLEAGTK